MERCKVQREDPTEVNIASRKPSNLRNVNSDDDDDNDYVDDYADDDDDDDDDDDYDDDDDDDDDDDGRATFMRLLIETISQEHS